MLQPKARKDYTGIECGIVKVLGPDQEDIRRWTIHWRCCDRLEAVSADRMRTLIQRPPKSCIHCLRRITSEDDAYSRDSQKRELERQRAKGAKSEPPIEGVHIPGRGWWPVLQGPFGRLHQNGHEGANPGWREHAQ